MMADGQVVVPGDGRTADWWKDAAPPGSRQGGTLIVGHLDTRCGPQYS